MDELKVTAPGTSNRPESKEARHPAPSSSSAPARENGNSSQTPGLNLSATAQSINNAQSQLDRKGHILEILKKPLLPSKDKEEVLRLLETARKDGKLAHLVRELSQPPEEGGDSPLKQLYKKMGTPASQGISDLFIIAFSFGSTVLDDWKRDKRQDLLNILKAGKIETKVIAELQSH